MGVTAQGANARGNVGEPAPSPLSRWRMNVERPNRVTWSADSKLEDERAAYWDLLRQFHDRHRDAMYDQHFTIWFRPVHQ